MEDNIDLNKYKPNKPAPRPWPTWFIVCVIMLSLTVDLIRHNFESLSYICGSICILLLIVSVGFLYKLLRYYRASMFYYILLIWGSLWGTITFLQKMGIIEW